MTESPSQTSERAEPSRGGGPETEALPEATTKSENTRNVKPVSAAELLRSPPPKPEPILVGLFDKGDKVLITGPPKTGKTFFALDLAVSLSQGAGLLNWKTAEPRAVLYAQLEITEAHFYERFASAAKAKGLEASDFAKSGNLHISSLRGVAESEEGAFSIIRDHALALEPDVLIIDPFYKIQSGTEKDDDKMKPALAQLDRLARETGMAIIIVHHDPKGVAGNRDIRDRGSGSNVLMRDCDLAITLTPHVSESPSLIVVSALSRNYPSDIKGFTAELRDGIFHVREDISPETAKRSGNQKQTTGMLDSEFIPSLLQLVNGEARQETEVIGELRNRCGLTTKKARNVVKEAIASKDHDFGEHNGGFPRTKWIGSAAAIEAKKRELEAKKNT